jgi:hypothetical protein
MVKIVQCRRLFAICRMKSHGDACSEAAASGNGRSKRPGHLYRQRPRNRRANQYVLVACLNLFEDFSSQQRSLHLLFIHSLVRQTSQSQSPTHTPWTKVVVSRARNRPRSIRHHVPHVDSRQPCCGPIRQCLRSQQTLLPHQHLQCCDFPEICVLPLQFLSSNKPLSSAALHLHPPQRSKQHHCGSRHCFITKPFDLTRSRYSLQQRAETATELIVVSALQRAFVTESRARIAVSHPKSEPVHTKSPPEAERLHGTTPPPISTVRMSRPSDARPPSPPHSNDGDHVDHLQSHPGQALYTPPMGNMPLATMDARYGQYGDPSLYHTAPHPEYYEQQPTVSQQSLLHSLTLH